MKYQVVKIGDKFAVRQKWFHCGRFQDLKSKSCSWEQNSDHFDDCLSDEATARKEADYLTRRYRPKIKPVVIDEYPLKASD